MSGDTEAALRARIRELEACRATIVETGIAERRRIERDLHDGAQQRIVALSLQTNVARYAGAHVARVRVGRVDGHAYVEVRDDGIGGADPAVVRAEVPCASS